MPRSAILQANDEDACLKGNPCATPNAIPPIPEEVPALKERLRPEHDGHKKPRLQMLYLLANGQSHTRQDVARLLGVHRNTISHWLPVYGTGGLAALLATYVPPGRVVSLAPEVLASLE